MKGTLLYKIYLDSIRFPLVLIPQYNSSVVAYLIRNFGYALVSSGADMSEHIWKRIHVWLLFWNIHWYVCIRIMDNSGLSKGGCCYLLFDIFSTRIFLLHFWWMIFYCINYYDLKEVWWSLYNPSVSISVVCWPFLVQEFSLVY